MDKKELREPFRLSVRVSADANDWLDKKSYETGTSKSALVNFAVEQYMQNSETLTTLPELARLMEAENLKK